MYILGYLHLISNILTSITHYIPTHKKQKEGIIYTKVWFVLVICLIFAVCFSWY